MGRRKERRMAAISAAGRRVKLDLSVEPTGDVAHSSLHTEVGVDHDQEEQAGNPSSPSSSDEKQGNPLLLLGQYSDEEVGGNANEVEKTDLEETSVHADDKEEKNVDLYDNTTKTDKHAVSNNDKLEFSKGDEKNIVDRVEIQKTNIVNGTDPHNGVHPTIGTCDLDASGAQIVEDGSGGWQLVMHESHRYYYWNTLTGETSWEIPDVLAQAAGSSAQHISPLPLDQSLPYVASGAVDMGNDGIISRSTPVYMIGTSAGLEGSDAVNMIYNTSQTLQNYGNNGINVSVNQDEDRDKQLTGESHEGTDVHSAPLMMQCESLLEKLKAIDRSDLALKFIVEVETRLSDCKALSSFGPSILPFWLHTKTQLNQLESVIEKEISGYTKSDHCNVVDYTDSSPIQGGSEMAKLGNGTLSSSEHFHPCDVDNEQGIKKEEIQLPAESLIENGNLHSGSPCHISNSGPKSVNLDESTPSSHFIAKVEYGAGEDVDMDVEMEVDEETPIIDQATRGSSSTEHPVLQEEFVQPVPPPPDEEWVPPPPPDAEPDPPLPPEEPPSVPPPSYAETVHSFPYVEQYSLGYSIPRFQYYVPSSDGAQGVGYYADEAHVAERQPVQCYESTSYTNVAAVVSAGPVVYYDPQSASIHADPAVTSSDPSFYVELKSISHAGDVSSDHPGSAEIFTKAGNYELPLQNAESDFSSAVSKTEKRNVPANSASGISQTNENVHMKRNDADATSTIATKNTSKVARGKKRVVMVAPTLRSNKKVSSLVDKWKAAKEELHEDEEDESEYAYEVLEKKRQKEIEEWRARQIASGEAQENANFLPLGGDWRERVKRRRAESSAVSLNTPSEEDNNEKPDLVELLKGLPSGWQVYWDESSKKVYYGNLNTSESTWTRPS